MKPKLLSDAARTILSNATVCAGVVTLHEQISNRALYEEVDRALQVMGGHWKRERGGHIFTLPDNRIRDLLVLAWETGLPEGKPGFFETPDVIIDQMLGLANIEPGMRVLEPSAGRGAIVCRLSSQVQVVAVEKDPDFLDELSRYRLASLRGADFLECTAKELGLFDSILMNPPFEHGQDAKHVLHAYNEFLKPGGELVAVMSAGVQFRTTEPYQRVRDLVRTCGRFISLPPDSFKESGTNVRTVLCTLSGL